ncbi:MAG: thermonuclease family protein [Patescibacteria group bacterium]
MKKFFAILAAVFALALPALALNIPEGAIVKTVGNPDVYVVKYLNGKSYKRLVLNPQVFESYRHLKWEDLVTVDQATINSFATSDLVRVDGTTEIYRLTPNDDNGSKVLVTDTESLDLNGVYTINSVDFENYAEANVAANLTGPYDIYKIIDGDTLTVSIDGANKTVRLIGIDTPEIASSYTAAQCYGIQASQAAKDKLAGKKIYLEADPVSGDKDKYDRLLRYVHLEDGTLFNKCMVEEGNAKEYTYAGITYKYQSEFKTAQTSAATARKGLWSVCRSK